VDFEHPKRKKPKCEKWAGGVTKTTGLHLNLVKLQAETLAALS
jgi:hypothetical protein